MVLLYSSRLSRCSGSGATITAGSMTPPLPVLLPPLPPPPAGEPGAEEAGSAPQPRNQQQPAPTSAKSQRCSPFASIRMKSREGRRTRRAKR